MKHRWFIMLALTLTALTLVAGMQFSMQGVAAFEESDEPRPQASAFTIEKTVITPTGRPAVVSDTIIFEIVITNITADPQDIVVLQDDYITRCLLFMDGAPLPDMVDPANGMLYWNTLPTVGPEMSTTVVISFHADIPCDVVTNTAILPEWGVEDTVTTTILGEEETLSDLGDAPDSTNHFGAAMTAYPAGGPPGIQARYPTVFDPMTGLPQGPKHYRAGLFSAWLGLTVTHEYEADLMPDADGVPNIDPPPDVPDQDMADDAIDLPLWLPHCVTTTFEYTVTVDDPGAYLVNAWFDWNRDGDWQDVFECPNAALTPEWAVRHQYLNFSAAGIYTVTTPAFLPYNPNPHAPNWMRITLTPEEQPPPSNPQTDRPDGRGPDIGYDGGETEDYYLPGFEPEPRFDLGDAPDSTSHHPFTMTAYLMGGGAPNTQAHYPTVFDPATGLPQGPRHVDPQHYAWLGAAYTLEYEADYMPDTDGVPNIVPPSDSPDWDGADDAIDPPLSLPHCVSTTFDYTVTVQTAGTYLVNAWFDWNRDGDWQDMLECTDGTPTPEWAVRQQVLNLTPGTHRITTPVFLPFNSDPQDPMWMRITLTGEGDPPPFNPDTDRPDGRGPREGYGPGETEDYYLPGWDEDPDVDIFIRDNSIDTGTIPTTYPPGWWRSPDIWVRHADDGNSNHQNPELGETNYVNVNVHHRLGVTATNVTADLYWGNVALGFGWPGGWHHIGSVNIGDLPPGVTATQVISWHTPNIGGHFCFLVRTEADQDPITDNRVRWENNIAQRNFNIVDDVPERTCDLVTPDIQTDTVTMDVVNTLAITTAVDVVLNSSTFPTATGVISLDLGSLWGHWSGLTNFNQVGTTLEVTAFPARIHGLTLGPSASAPMTATLVAPGNVSFDVEFTEEIGGQKIGGVNYYQIVPSCLYLPLILRSSP